MSEDVKPRKIWTSGFHLETIAGDINQKISIAVEELGAKSNVKGDRFFWIELEPTMRMMGELADAVEKEMSHDFDCGITVNGRHECSCNYLKAKEALEKYKKFKDGLK